MSVIGFLLHFFHDKVFFSGGLVSMLRKTLRVSHGKITYRNNVRKFSKEIFQRGKGSVAV